MCYMGNGINTILNLLLVLLLGQGGCTSKWFSVFSFVFGFILSKIFQSFIHSLIFSIDWLYSFRDFPLNFDWISIEFPFSELPFSYSPSSDSPFTIPNFNLFLIFLCFRIFTHLSPWFLFYPFILWFNSFIFLLIHLFYYFFIHLFYFSWHPRPVFDLFHPLFRCIYY